MASIGPPGTESAPKDIEWFQWVIPAHITRIANVCEYKKGEGESELKEEYYLLYLPCGSRIKTDPPTAKRIYEILDDLSESGIIAAYKPVRV